MLKIEVSNASELTEDKLKSFIQGVRNDLEVQRRINPQLREIIEQHERDNIPFVVKYISSHASSFEADIARKKIEHKFTKQGRKIIKRINPKKPKRYFK